jgi:anthranilate/para-aminobenzoate synthase component II
MTRQSTQRAAALLAATLTLGLGGCGGASTRAATSPGPRPPASGGHAAIIGRCSARADGDPAALGLCLASHHVVVPGGGGITRCMQAANTRADVTACLARAAR